MSLGNNIAVEMVTCGFDSASLGAVGGWALDASRPRKQEVHEAAAGTTWHAVLWSVFFKISRKSVF